MKGVRTTLKNRDRAITKPCLQLMVGLAFMVTLTAAPLQAQQPSTDDLRQEIHALTQTVKEMQKDLQEIKALLLSRGPAAPSHNVVLDLANKPSKGGDRKSVV